MNENFNFNVNGWTEKFLKFLKAKMYNNQENVNVDHINQKSRIN